MNNYRAVFLSDIHLGTPASKAGPLVEFIDNIHAEKVYLVGDIIDGWRLRKQWYWPQEHNDVIQKLLRMVRKGTHMVYVPGNHDEFLREFVGHSFGGVEIIEETVHEMLDGRKFMIIHGDAFDLVIQNHHWLGVLGSHAYDYLVVANRWLHYIRSAFGLPYWSLAGYLKGKVKGAVNFIDNFEVSVAEEAGRRGLQGAICGHIHKAEIRDIAGITYANIGDGVDSCCCLVENLDGTLETVHWGR